MIITENQGDSEQIVTIFLDIFIMMNLILDFTRGLAITIGEKQHIP